MILPRATSAASLLNLAMSTLSSYIFNSDYETGEEADAVGNLLQNLEDWHVVWDIMGAGERVKAEFSFKNDLKNVQKFGLEAYAGVQKNIIKGNGNSGDWPMLILCIIRVGKEPYDFIKCLRRGSSLSVFAPSSVPKSEEDNITAE